MDVMAVLKTLADENRLRILNLLNVSSLCVGELQTLLGLNQSNASRHLDKLKSCGLIYGEKKAQWTYYHTSRDTLDRYVFIRQLLSESLTKEPIFREDIFRLRRYETSGLNFEHLRENDFDYSRMNF